MLVDSDLSRTNLAFVAATPLTAVMLGGPATADAKCTEIAHAAGRGGAFVAWVSTSSNPVSNRLGAARGWVRTDGRPFVDTIADLTAGRILYPLRRDEHNTDRVVAVLTGTSPLGGGAGEDCIEYTSSSSSELMLIGTSDGGTNRWTNNSEGPCSDPYAYYCLQIDHAFALPAPSEPGPIAFLSSTNISSQNGIAAADQLCQTDATAAGVPGTFLALLSTTQASALSRFSALPAQPWVRVDGVATTRDFVTWDAPIEVTAAGVHVDAPVFGGSSTAAQVSASAAESCNNWGPGGTSARIGDSARASDAGFGAGSGSCGLRRVYCLQKL